jgi:nitrite reductase/ring-hydroxylating ferredoxin subunit
VTGRRLCRLDDIPDGEAKGFTIETATGMRDILVHRDRDVARGYVNSCPHVGSPLDWAPDRFIAPDGFHLLCATHGALFRPQDGFCVSGPCAGESLAPVAVTVASGEVVLASDTVESTT